MEAQIAHCTRKVKNTQKLSEQVLKDVEKKEEKLNSLTRDLVSVKKAADAAQGNFLSTCLYPSCLPVDRGSAESFPTKHLFERGES